jgi:hypothetical protein
MSCVQMLFCTALLPQISPQRGDTNCVKKSLCHNADDRKKRPSSPSGDMTPYASEKLSRFFCSNNTDFSVVLFRPNFMLASEGLLMKMHKNQWLLNFCLPLKSLGKP